MMEFRIDEYLLHLEKQLLQEAKEHKIILTRKWAKDFPNESAVYIFRENGHICYVGETGSLRGRMTDILNTKNHTVRRNIGNHYYSHLSDYEKPSSRKGFSEHIESLLNERLESSLTISYIVVKLGRKELEERLFDKLNPKFSLKGKRSSKIN